MTISPLALAAKKVIDAAWLHGDAYDLSSQAAFALESAQLLQSPETAAEHDQLRARAAELEARLAEYERPVDEDPVPYALTDKAELPYVSRPLPPRDAVCGRSGCGHSGADHHHGDTKCWARLPVQLGDPVTVCSCSGFVAEDDVSQDRFTAVASPVEYGYVIAVRRDPHPAGHVPVSFPRLEVALWSPEAATELLHADYGYTTAPGSYWQPLGEGRYGVRLCRAKGGAR